MKCLNLNQFRDISTKRLLLCFLLVLIGLYVIWYVFQALKDFDPDEIPPPVRSHYVPRTIKPSDGNEFFKPTIEPNSENPSKTDSMSGGGR